MQSALFSAPFNFLPTGLVKAWKETLDVQFVEIWNTQEIDKRHQISVWAPNPGQTFVIDRVVLDKFPALELISTPSTGKNHIDLDECKNRGIAVYGLTEDRLVLDKISASAEFTFLLLLNALRRLDIALNETAAGRWRQREQLMRGHELAGKTVGLVGYGRIGQRIGRWLSAFDAHVQRFDPYVIGTDLMNTPISQLFSECHIVVICCSLTAETHGMIGRELLEHLRPNAILINTSRGEILDESALAVLLNQRPDITVALDVLSGEVVGKQYDSPLVTLQKQGRVVISPHIAGATFESQTKAALGALRLIQRHYGLNQTSFSIL